MTGLSVIAARNSAGMINKLNRALTVEFAFIAAFVGLAFRSVRVGLACLMPGIFPVVAAGSLLRLFGALGLQFSGVVALTVSFGLGLSATIHFLNRMTQKRRRQEDPAIAVEQATVLMGPALILTALVLACGLAALVFSDLPPLRLFGWLGALAMLAALAADLLILRPVVTFLLRLGRRTSAPRADAGLTDPTSRKRAHNVCHLVFVLRCAPERVAGPRRGRRAGRAAVGCSGGQPVRQVRRRVDRRGPDYRIERASRVRSDAVRNMWRRKSGAALNQTIVCASESFKLDIHSYAEASGELVQGYWRETGRDLSGHMTGRISEGRFEGEIVAPTFTAAISLASNGRQTVSIQPRGGDISKKKKSTPTAGLDRQHPAPRRGHFQRPHRAQAARLTKPTAGRIPTSAIPKD